MWDNIKNEFQRSRFSQTVWKVLNVYKLFIYLVIFSEHSINERKGFHQLFVTVLFFLKKVTLHLPLKSSVLKITSNYTLFPFVWPQRKKWLVMLTKNFITNHEGMVTLKWLVNISNITQVNLSKRKIKNWAIYS